jgi:hypothetical protein
VKLSRGAMVFIGAKYPQGNKLQFDSSPKGRRMFFWGRDGGRIRPRPNPHFLQKAYDETKSKQLAAFQAQLEIEMRELKIG